LHLEQCSRDILSKGTKKALVRDYLWWCTKYMSFAEHHNETKTCPALSHLQKSERASGAPQLRFSSQLVLTLSAHWVYQVKHRIASRVTAVYPLLYVEKGTFLNQKLRNHQSHLVGKLRGPSPRQLKVPC
jgi:hypothetical protein